VDPGFRREDDRKFCRPSGSTRILAQPLPVHSALRLCVLCAKAAFYSTFSNFCYLADNDLVLYDQHVAQNRYYSNVAWSGG
jgi:hypothetical protein